MKDDFWETGDLTNTVRFGYQVLDSPRFSGVHLLGDSALMLVRVNPENRPKRTVLRPDPVFL